MDGLLDTPTGPGGQWTPGPLELLQFLVWKKQKGKSEQKTTEKATAEATKNCQKMKNIHQTNLKNSSLQV